MSKLAKATEFVVSQGGTVPPLRVMFLLCTFFDMWTQLYSFEERPKKTRPLVRHAPATVGVGSPIPLDASVELRMRLTQMSTEPSNHPLGVPRINTFSHVGYVSVSEYVTGNH